jgi:Tol biopolymer transport system component
LGPYEILAPLGAGGMGEVYRARDKRLEREVAVKILADHLSSSPEIRERFDREAHAISSLNHPRICTLHDVGQCDGTDYLVMEYLEGQTLGERLAKGPLPLKEVVRIGTEICEGLEAAHRQGLVHRDLKPGNIMLTKTGAKLMDFGLAKPIGMRTAAAVASGAPPSFTAVATMTGPSPLSPLTAAGSIVGTIQYMSPEQIEGKEADARSDIFALGAILYEMTTGTRAFEGKSQLSLASAILEHEPAPIASIQPLTPPALERIVLTCLAKDPVQRLQSAHDVGLQLSWIGGKEEILPRTKPQTSRAGWIAAASVLALAFIAAYFVVHSWPRTTVLQASIATPEGMTTELVGDFSAPPTLSPDGTMLVIRGRAKNDPDSALWIRHLDAGTWQRLDGTEKANFPFWSPDSKNVAFFTTDQKLRRIAVIGGAASDIAAAPVGRGGSWGKDDTILFSPDFQSGLFRVSANGGAPTPVTKLNQAVYTTHRWPALLPDGKHFLYFAGSHAGISSRQYGVYFASLDGKVDRMLLESDANAIYSDGYLLFHSQSALQARRFNPTSGEFEGSPVTVSDDVQYDSATWHCSVSASETGLLVFAGGGQAAGAELAWFDRSGKSEAVPNLIRADYLDVRLSPDGHRILVVKNNPYADLWVIDGARGTPTRLTFDTNDHFTPVWSPDGKRIAYGQAAAAGSTAQFGFGASLHVIDADGSGKNEEVLPADATANLVTLLDWTKDGKYLIYARRTGLSPGQIWALPLTGERKPFVVMTAPSFSTNLPQGRVSPDEHWLVYTSDESGRAEVYITSFPVAGAKVAASTGGGFDPKWRGDGKELYFGSITNGAVMAVDVKTAGTEVQLGQPHQLFSVTGSTLHWDARGDGQRFIMPIIPETGSKPMTLISNWRELVARK